MRPRAQLLCTVLAALLSALLVVPVSQAGRAKTPTIRKVRPAKVAIGQTLTIRGSGFRQGKATNTVVFSRRGTTSLFVRADLASTTLLRVVLPDKLTPFLIPRSGKPVSTRFRVRVLAKRLSPKTTSKSLSPVIAPKTTRPPPPLPPGDCDNDGIVNPKDADDDNDLLTDDQERSLKTDACKPDTDGDRVEDYFEYESARDLNACPPLSKGADRCPAALPYPGKRPYPNALDATDAGKDYDGDALTNFEEYSAWSRYGGRAKELNYSDGAARSTGDARDDERDVDSDGLGNYVEAHGPLSDQSWWTEAFDQEKAYKTITLGTDWLDPDSDGDGRLDGADDQDFDGYDNASESTRARFWMQPFNPCLPDPTVDICSPYHPPPDESWPPFDLNYTKASQGPLAPPAPDASTGG